jgi:hypothetical protein
MRMLVRALETLAFPGFFALVAGEPLRQFVDAFDADAQFDKVNDHPIQSTVLQRRCRFRGVNAFSAVG